MKWEPKMHWDAMARATSSTRSKTRRGVSCGRPIGRGAANRFELECPGPNQSSV